MSSQIRVQVITGGFGSSIPTCGLHAYLNELAAVSRSDYDVLVCVEFKVSDRRHLSELRILDFGCRQQRLRTLSLCPGYGSLCKGRIPFLAAEQVGVFLQ